MTWAVVQLDEEADDVVKRGIFSVEVHEATGLSDEHLFGEVHPYVRLSLDNCVVKTDVCLIGGSTPQWTSKNSLHLPVEPEMKDMSVNFGVWDHDHFDDECLGQGEHHVLELCNHRKPYTFTVPLSNIGQPAGELKVTVTYIPSHPEYLYAMGGTVDQWESAGGLVERFDPVEKIWSAMASIPRARSDAPASNLLGNIYIVGGSGPCPSAEVDMYDVHADKWSRCTDMAQARTGCALVACGGKLYAMGGSSDIYGNGTTTGEVYDPQSELWSPLPDMKCERRKGCAAVSCDGSIYVMGGEEFDVDAVPPRRETTGWVEKLNPKTGKWSECAPMPTPRGCLAAVAMEDKIYAIGGIGEGESSADCPTYATVECYDPAMNTWLSVAPLGVARAKLAASLVQGKLYVCGGHSYDADECKDVFYSTVECYDPLHNSWQAVTPLGVPRACLACAAAVM